MSPDTRMNVATELSERILVRPDFKELITGLERSVATMILSHRKINNDYDEWLQHGMRFADILSYSSVELHRNMAYSIVALFQELKDQDQLSKESVDTLDAYSAAILAALGNFPGLKKLEDSVEDFQYTIPADRVINRDLKELIQRTSDGKHVLTDAQFEVAQSLQNFDFYSFSGPTSLGKSFVIKDFVRSEISSSSFNDKCVVFVVPTNALVSQTARDFRRELRDFKNINIAIHPVQPQLMLRKYRSTIYVFTPERLIRFLSTKGREIKLLVVDEAHRIVSPNDSRSPLFYYAIDQVLRTYASKLVFSSPSLSNPGLFLELFGKSSTGSVLIHERTVSQQRFFIDLINREAFYFPLDTDALPERVRTDGVFKSNSWGAIEYLANGTKSLIYVNTPGKVVNFALEFKSPDGLKLNSRTRALIQKIKAEVHPEYFLIDALKNGVAFHHGRIPVSIREEIEAVFKDPESGVDFLVCTSTLLEGVNLPARNIFVLTDSDGTGNKFKKIDFENLAGRAGRLTKDFKGNVFCLRLKDGEWEDPEHKIRQSEPQEATSFLLDPKKSRKKHYTDIEKVLLRQPLPTDRSVPQIEVAEKYAAILMIQSLSNTPSLLTQKFKDKAKDASGTLEKVVEEVKVDIESLRRSPEFDPIVQEQVRKQLARLKAPVAISSTEDIRFESVLEVLIELSRLYDWKEREGRGRGAMFRRNSSKRMHDQRLRYWAQLVVKWMTGKPIHLVIQSSLQHYKKVGEIYLRDYSKPKGQPPYRHEAFDLDSKVHVNHVIEETMTDIEYGVGFKILSYLKNYHDLCVQVFGEKLAGLDLSILIEFGTSDQTAIELQQMGYSRYASGVLRNQGSKYLSIEEGGSIREINTEGILLDDNLSDIVKDETKALFAA